MTGFASLSRWSAVAVIALALYSGRAFAVDSLVEPHIRGDDYVGTMSCTSASCHGGQVGQAGLVWQQVYSRWLGSKFTYREGRGAYDPRAQIERHLGDPHALAAQRMKEPRFQEVLRRYSLRADCSLDAAAGQKCAGCHDPTAIHLGSLSELKDRDAITRSEMRTMGIGCESCHGGARRWLAAHYRRDVSRDELTELGMIDTKDLLTRARVCATCHVGSTENDMNHDMLAAGHPPLRFELASYEALLAPKHWDDRPRRALEPDYEVRLWAAGRVASGESMLALLEGRTRRAPWPEFAESDCAACHQSLLPPQTSSLTSSLKSGRIMPWQTWNQAFLSEALAIERPASDELSRPSGLEARFNDLRHAMERSLMPAAVTIGELAGEARVELSTVCASGSRAPLSGATELLLEITERCEDATWDELCQRLAALVAARRALDDQHLLDDRAAGDVRAAERRIAASLRRPGGALPAEERDSIADELETLRLQLLREAKAQRTNRLMLGQAP